MKYCVGIDLGSTTTKAVILDEDGKVMGRGITNSRSNYEVACEVAVAEALINARFGLIDGKLKDRGVEEKARKDQLQELEQGFRLAQYLDQCNILREEIMPLTETARSPYGEAVGAILIEMEREAGDLFGKGSRRKSDFFRDLAGSRYLVRAEKIAKDMEISYDHLVGFFDKAILRVENHPADSHSFGRCIRAALDASHFDSTVFRESVEEAGSLELEQIGSVGTGYGRQTLPFPKEDIRSEILCHGLGAHAMFPGTRTVLDIGGQDTKAIQVDTEGIVTSFQMNDRCAAGCGRYLGYIADEMNLGLHELGPLACSSKRSVKINSTCTVFAGAELRERLSLGEKREDILAGLHRAIILRAMSLLARSGGVANEFTFTGGVAKNEAAVGALKKLIFENYGEVTLNISPDSIYTGALGAAIFSHREWTRSKETVSA